MLTNPRAKTSSDLFGCHFSSNPRNNGTTQQRPSVSSSTYYSKYRDYYVLFLIMIYATVILTIRFKDSEGKGSDASDSGAWTPVDVPFTETFPPDVYTTFIYNSHRATFLSHSLTIAWPTSMRIAPCHVTMSYVTI